jgi:hypothetical protein
MRRTAAKREKPLATWAALLSVVVLLAGAAMPSHASAIAPSYPETRDRVSSNLSSACNQLESELSRDLRQGYEQSSDLEAVGSLDAPGRGGSFGGSRFSSAEDFASEAFTRYQRYTDEAYEAALRAEARGRLVVPEGMSRETIIGQRVDAAARIRMRRWLRSEGIGEGPGELVQVNRWLRDPFGSGRYRIPDVRIPGANSIMDGTIGYKWSSTLQIRDFSSFSGGNRITIVRPRALGGSYSLWP